jgi:hypothetical protein
LEHSHTAIFAGPPAKKIYEKGKPPKAALMLLLLLNAGMPSMKVCKKLLALWPQWWWKLGCPPDEIT